MVLSPSGNCEHQMKEDEIILCLASCKDSLSDTYSHYYFLSLLQ